MGALPLRETGGAEEWEHYLLGTQVGVRGWEHFPPHSGGGGEGWSTAQNSGGVRGGALPTQGLRCVQGGLGLMPVWPQELTVGRVGALSHQELRWGEGWGALPTRDSGGVGEGWSTAHCGNPRWGRGVALHQVQVG